MAHLIFDIILLFVYFVVNILIAMSNDDDNVIAGISKKRCIGEFVTCSLIGSLIVTIVLAYVIIADCIDRFRQRKGEK